MGKEALVETFCRLVRTASPTGSESAMAELVADYLRELGLEPQSDDAHEHCPAECGNLYAFLPATAADYPTLMLNAHLDTVGHDHPIMPVVEGDLVRSAGDTILGADDKAGVTLILLALRRIIDQDLPHGGIWLVFTVAEETGLWGAYGLDYDRFQPGPELGYVLDGGRQAGKMTTAAPSAVSLDVTITGKAAHAGVCPEAGISAIQVAATAISRMKLGRLDEETTANVGMIEGGSARNIVPERCALQAEARSHSEEKLNAQVADMRSCLVAAAEEAGAEVDIEVKRSYTAFALTVDAPVVKRATAAAQRLGLEPVTERGGGGSDANVFNERGIPSLMMATGALNVHTPDEQLHLPTALKCLAWLVEVLTSRG